MSRDSPVTQRPNNINLSKLRTLIQQEINQAVIKDTYTRGKHAGLRKALALIADMQSDINKKTEQERRQDDKT